MAENSTLQRTTNLRLEEDLASLLEGKATSDNMERVDSRDPIHHILVSNLGSQAILYPASPRNDPQSDREAVEPPFTAPGTPEFVETVDGFWHRVLSAQKLIGRCPVVGSNYWPRRFRSDDPIFQVGGVTWGALIASEPIGGELAEALLDLNGAMEEAEEQGYPEPAPVALFNARRLLRKLFRITPRRFEVYPTPDAEIAIDVSADGMSLVVLCDAAGGALCMANLPDGHHTKSYPNTDILPDGFVSEALAKLLPDSN